MAQSINPVTYDQLPEATKLDRGDLLFCFKNGIFYRFNHSLLAPANATLAAETGSGTDTTTPAITSLKESEHLSGIEETQRLTIITPTVASVLQTIWGKIRQVVNVLNTKTTDSVALTAETGSGTTITTPAVPSGTVNSVLQTIWDKIRQVVNVLNTKIDRSEGTWSIQMESVFGSVSSSSLYWERVGKCVFISGSAFINFTGGAYATLYTTDLFYNNSRGEASICYTLNSVTHMSELAFWVPTDSFTPNRVGFDVPSPPIGSFNIFITGFYFIH